MYIRPTQPLCHAAGQPQLCLGNAACAATAGGHVLGPCGGPTPSSAVLEQAESNNIKSYTRYPCRHSMDGCILTIIFMITIAI